MAPYRVILIRSFMLKIRKYPLIDRFEWLCQGLKNFGKMGISENFLYYSLNCVMVKLGVKNLANRFVDSQNNWYQQREKIGSSRAIIILFIMILLHADEWTSWKIFAPLRYWFLCELLIKTNFVKLRNMIRNSERKSRFESSIKHTIPNTNWIQVLSLLK